MFQIDTITGGFEGLDFFNNIVFVCVFELDNITLGSGDLAFLGNIGFVFELDNIIGAIGELGFWDNIEQYWNCQGVGAWQYFRKDLRT